MDGVGRHGGTDVRFQAVAAHHVNAPLKKAGDSSLADGRFLPAHMLHFLIANDHF
jgi:hypothetical protein